MAYEIQPSDNTKQTLVVEDASFNTDTSLTFVGRNQVGFSTAIGENFYHLLENFANGDPPANPVEGQLWYDNTEDINQLYIYDGVAWVPAAGVNKSPNKPAGSSITQGDIWVDTINQQLYIYSGSDWILVGPTYAEGSLTGVRNEQIVDTDNVTRNVVVNYVDGVPVIIISTYDFIPKSAIDGFTTIYSGLNLNTQYNEIAGSIAVANALNVNGNIVDADKFHRNDQGNISSYLWKFRSDDGINVGPNDQLQVKLITNTSVFYNNATGVGFDFRTKISNAAFSALTIDGNGRVGINNNGPTEPLDVVGNVKIGIDDNDEGKLTVESTVSDSIETAGGIVVAKGITVGTILSSGEVSSELFTAGNPGASDIGSEASPFTNVYADNLHGNLISTNTGLTVVDTSSSTATFTGNLSGSASRLANSTQFAITGDIVSNTISFNGDGTAKTFTTSLSADLINNKTAVTSIVDDDEFLIYRPSIAGLRKATKQTLVSTLPFVPVGTILPYAGQTPPTGYLFCDGTEISQTAYSALFTVIGHSFNIGDFYDSTGLLGNNTFKLPDMRGRLPLGLDIMENDNIFVTANTPPYNLIQTGGALGPANRVASAVDVGLTGSGVNTTGSQSGTGANGYPLASTQTPVLPPYQVINYIIFTGVI